MISLTRLQTSAIVLDLLLLAMLLTSCGPGQREHAISTAFAGVNSAKAGFETLDAEYQAHIVESATSFVDGQEKLAAYRKQREVVVEAFATAYAALAAGAIDGKTPMSKIYATVEALAKAIASLRAHLDTAPAQAPASSPTSTTSPRPSNPAPASSNPASVP